jgi:GH25 family lysozyme M1 (1,4-beta-N-acetylmuramidase)
MRLNVARRSRHAASSRLAAALIVALVVIGGASLSAPNGVRAGTLMAAACDGVRLRTGPSTGYSTAQTVTVGTQVNVEATVAGGSWSATCAGSVSGATWYQITELNGQSVTTLFGVGFVYAATGLFQAVTTPAPTPTPTPDPAATPTPTPDPLATPTPTPTPDPFASPSASPTPSPTPFQPVTEGIDVSHYQNAIDWTQVAAAGKRFAFMKASEGTTLVDETYSTNRAQAKAVGLYVGAYHFARPGPDLGSAVAEADYFLAMSQLEAGDLVPVLDLEDTGGLSPADLQVWVQAYLERIYERTGVHGLIYTSPTFWQNAMGDTAWFAMNGYPMVWVAHWTTGPAPIVPAGNWGGDGWTFWQYSSSGSVPGISGRVDLDRFNGLDLTPLVLTSGVIPAVAPVLALTPSTDLITWGETVVMKASFGPSGAGRSFSLQASPDGASWQTIATLTADAEGNASFSYRPANTFYYRAAFDGAPDLVAMASSSARVQVRQTVLLRPTSSGATKVVSRGRKVTFTMTVRPRRADVPRAKVTLDIFQRVGGHWTLFKKRDIYVDAAGIASYRWTFSTRGQWYVRSFANSTPFNAISAWSQIERYSVR